MSEASPFFVFKSWAFHPDCALSLKARVVGLVLTDHMGKGRFSCYVSLSRLAALTGQSSRSAWTAAQELAEAGFFSLDSGSGANGGRANTYTLTRRTKLDPRKVCKGEGARTLANSARKPRRPSQVSARTLARIANQPPMNLLTDEPLQKERAGQGDREDDAQSVDLDRLTRRVADSHRLPVFPGARHA